MQRSYRKLTGKSLENATRAYIDRYASSSENLRRVLMRRVERRCRARGEDPAEWAGVVDDIVRRCRESGLVDDRRYAEMKVASLRRRGASARMIAGKLHAKGVERELVDTALSESEDDDISAAAAFARRRRLGPWRAVDRFANRDRDLARLARAGFSYTIASSIIDGSAEQPDTPNSVP